MAKKITQNYSYIYVRTYVYVHISLKADYSVQQIRLEIDYLNLENKA